MLRTLVTFTAPISILWLPEGDGSFETGKLILSKKRRSFLLEITALRVNQHLKIMTLNHKKIQHVSKFIELLFIRGYYIVYRDVLESRQIRRAFKLVNPKHEDQASVRNGNSLGQINLLVCQAEICKQCVRLF